MLGWTILFALFALPGATAAAMGYPGAISLKTASAVFTVLLLMFILTRWVRSTR
jgi:hypothetical protein